MRYKQTKIPTTGVWLPVNDWVEIFMFVKQVAKMRGIRTQAILGALKNTLV